MSIKLNKACILFLATDIDQAATRSQKAFREIANSISTSHPEITLPAEDWAQLDEKTRSAILARVRKTLEAIR